MARSKWQMGTRMIASAFFGVGLFLFSLPALASSFPAFDQTIKVENDGTLSITENINVVFDTPRHGIFRDIPVKYKTDAGNPFNLRVKVVSVTDGSDSVNLPYSTSMEDGRLRVKIGDPDTTVKGQQYYRIRYRVSRALLFLKDQDQLYWNVATEPWGDLGWPESVVASVEFPSGVTSKQAQTRCFTGLGVGAPENCSKSDDLESFMFDTKNTPLTIVVGWPKGFVARPTFGQTLREWLADNWIIFWPFIVFAAMFTIWYKRGRDPKVTEAVVVQYEAPEGMSVGEMGVLLRQHAGSMELSATIVQLAVRGYLEISETDADSVFGKKLAYAFTSRKKADAGLSAHETEIMDGLFGSGAVPGTTVNLDDLKTTFYKTAAVARKQMTDAATARGWFAKNPSTVRAVWIGVAGAYVFLFAWLLSGFVAAAIGTLGPAAAIAIYAPAAIIAAFGYFMPARTAAGTAAYAKMLGFKEFIEKAEKYRAAWMEKENIFETCLPYAMLFGVADKWAKAFEGVQLEPPNWYHGSAMGVWSPVIFANSLNSAASTIGNSLATAPSGRGGGGFGGGGGGGGGFGGGGGGSW